MSQPGKKRTSTKKKIARVSTQWTKEIRASSKKRQTQQQQVSTRADRYAVRTRARSVHHVDEEEMHPVSAFFDEQTLPELLRHITRTPSDAAIAELLWRLGGTRSLFEQYFEISSFSVREDSPIADLLKAYRPRDLRLSHNSDLSDALQPKWISTWLTVRFPLDEGSSVAHPRTDYAAAFGNLRLLNWLNQNGYEKLQSTTSMAAEYGHLLCLMYATEKDFPKDTTTTSSAARNGHLHCLKYATENGFAKSAETTAAAAEGGHLECLIYATKHEFEKDSQAAALAAENGHLHCLKYVTENGFAKTIDTTSLAAKHGHLDCLIYATEHGFQKDSSTTMWAAFNGHLECLKYATEHGFLKHPKTRKVALDREHRECLLYARAHDFPQGNDVLSFTFPSTWFDFPMSRTIRVNVDIPISVFTEADMNAMTRQTFDKSFGTTCYNVMEADDVSMQDFLQEDKRNHVVALGPLAVSSSRNKTSKMHRPAEAMTRDQLMNQKADLSAQFFPCVGRNGTFPVDKSVRFIKLPLSYNPYVSESDLDAMLSATHASKQIWELTDSGLDVGTMASGTALVGRNFVSAHHCQFGTGRRIYRLSAIDLVPFYTPRATMMTEDSSSYVPSTERRLRPSASNSNRHTDNKNSKRNVKQIQNHNMVE